MLGDLTILKISVGDSTMVVSLPEPYECDDQNGTLANRNLSINLPPNPRYRISETQNKLIVVGCNALAVVADKDGKFRRGCASYCTSNVDFAKETTCSGQGCCQASIPGELTTLNITLSSIDQNVSNSERGHCARAFMVDNRPFNISNLTLPTFQDVGNNMSLVLDWMVESDDVCEKARSNLSSYACGKNTDCRNFGNGLGYRCVCRDGYNGNPYNPSKGCKAICSFGKKYKGKKNNKDRCPIAPGVIAGAAIVVSVFGITVTGSVSVTMKLRLRKFNFTQNGGEILKHRKVQIFTEVELAEATNNYNDSNKLNDGDSSSVYRGTIAEDTVVVVKKPKDMDKSLLNKDFQRELEILMNISCKNVVKLKGICLETKIPLLVYEYIPNSTTVFKLIQQNKLTWEQRFKIAIEAALALNHMHSSTQPPIFHGNIKLANMLMGRNNSVKISDFGTSVLISPEHRHIVAIQKKTPHYIDPEYLVTGMLTIQSDVYSFGVVLMELLMGKKLHVMKSEKSINTIRLFISSVKGDTLSDVISSESASEGEMDKIQTIAKIAVECLDQYGANRLKMSDVVEKLANVYPISTDKEEDEAKEEDEETKREVHTEELSSCLSCLGMDSCI
ncbi:wall-associated receptor kinase 3 [Eucalyptus grandis]|uniref:wall-associated receptor kinase 3 n=1 Tax=Eucalyptus grandis TaxID=71139 RepID=UPI00192F05A7|nr:wall-associated receptor kinase 3 [Eucalyptus grandis]